MRWRGFLLLIFLLCFLTAPLEAPTPASGDAEIYEEVGKYVALTFDDGPRRITTTRLLDGLQERGASATFFLIAQQIPGNEDVVQRMVAEGHQVGNHTFSHVCLQESKVDKVLWEIAQAEKLLTETAGEGHYWLRPPYGLVGQRESKLVQLPMIQWSVDPEDWKLLNSDKVVAAVMEHTDPGDIVLLHDIYPTTVDAALRVVDLLQAQGYSFVTVRELFALYGETAQSGKLYATPWRLYP